MILHQPRERPEPFNAKLEKLKHRWAAPLIAFDWFWEWVAYLLSHWNFLEVLEYLGSFSVLIAVILYFSEAPDRLKQSHYQAWQVIDAAQDKGGSGGRIEALEDLNHDRVPLVGVDLSGAFLMGVQLTQARLGRANISGADLRNANLSNADLSFADLHAMNIRGGVLSGAKLDEANLQDADLEGADLSGAELRGAKLSGADLRDANLAGIQWREIKSVEKANVAGVRNAPEFVAWARKNGAIEEAGGE
jgi:hypothetical protein